MVKLKVEYRKAAALIAYEGNARIHSDSQVAKIAASIQQFGFVNPVLVDQAGVVIAGHGRLAAAQQLGLKTVPVICVGHLSERERRALTLADNRIALDSQWDLEKLASEMFKLSEDGFDLELTGFTESEISEFEKVEFSLDDFDGKAELTKSDYPEEFINVEKDTDNSGVEDLSDPKFEKFVEKTFQVIQQVEEIGLPKPGFQLRLVTFRTFNAGLFLNYIAKQQEIDELLLVVYSINAEAAKMINQMIVDGRIKKAKILMSNLRNKAHRDKEQAVRDFFVNNPNVDLFFASSHAKMMGIKCADGNHYCVEGSGNLSFNSRIEQYVIDNDQQLYEFTSKWMDDVKVFLKGKKELVLT